MMFHTYQHAPLAFAILSLAFTAHAKTASEIYELAAKSTVVVTNLDDSGRPHSMGSGVVFSDGNVVTNCHVIKSAGQLKVRTGGKDFLATLRYSDWDRDVCSLSVSGLSVPAVVIGSTTALKVGAKVYAVGAPKGLELTLSDGIVSSLREVEGGRYIQTTAAISPGSSGGGLFDESGALVGLTTFYLSEGQSLNFAVPIEWVNELPKRSAKTATATQPITQWLNKSTELQSRQDWKAVLEHGRRWTNAEPNSVIAWIIMGVAHAQIGQYTKAIDAYQQALRINPEDATAWYHLGLDYANANQITKSIKAQQQALRISPEFFQAWYSIGLSYRKLGQIDKAIEAYLQALRINQDDIDVWNNLGVAYNMAYTEPGQLAKAMEAYQQALRINPNFSPAWYGLGISYALSGKRDKALEVYNRLKTLDAALAEQLFKLAMAL